ncbi:uncharacterized protein LOC127868059 [Dreissena polymorpha]|uniref:EF-hand domain-containing protein n=1 Tax=Dreissena polymorpha TaxID=45954 RepID=A0A9D4RS92_DREPO|nr:uncharacterized protein LOC127868059 [Dreissena polymorpha]KAH3876840.1 hypothetical protein DPMN_000690 [Dreissena polymorpha]
MTSFVLIVAFVVTCVSCQSNTFDVKGTVGQDGHIIGGCTPVFCPLRPRGNFGDFIRGLSRFERKRRSVEQMKFFTLSLDVNKCNFNLYDANRDDFLTKEELVTVFGDNTNTTALIDALDMLSGDGLVNREEFHYVMSRTVEGC